jgi:Calcineurin-like phosphoesterase
MRLQVLSDLHLETEHYDPEPAPRAELLVLAGDVDSTWAGLDRFRDWPVPVIFVAGNHELDGRELSIAWPALRERCSALGITMLERESIVLSDAAGRRVRFIATIRWSDFDLYGAAGRERALRAAGYYVRVMRATLQGLVFDAAAVREQALACRSWLEGALNADEGADTTVVITHYAPSLRSADPRYGRQPATASFCNADDALIPLATVWIHGHLHWRHDYRVDHPAGCTRVVCNARGHASKGEAAGYDDRWVIEV